MSVLIYARVTRKVRAIVRAKTNWHKVRTGVRKIQYYSRPGTENSIDNSIYARRVKHPHTLEEVKD